MAEAVREPPSVTSKSCELEITRARFPEEKFLRGQSGPVGCTRGVRQRQSVLTGNWSHNFLLGLFLTQQGFYSFLNKVFETCRKQALF